MKKVIRIDQNGYFVEDVLLEDWEETSEGLVSLEVPAGLYLPRYVAGEWVEGKSQEEIDAIRNVVAPKTEFELLQEESAKLKNELLVTQTVLDFVLVNFIPMF